MRPRNSITLHFGNMVGLGLCLVGKGMFYFFGAGITPKHTPLAMLIITVIMFIVFCFT
jgi:hypothetical protein